MATKELLTIHAVLRTKDRGILFGPAVDDLFVAYGDVWSTIKDYYTRYRAVPELQVIAQRFPSLHLEDAETAGPAEYYLDQLKEEFIDVSTERILRKWKDERKAGRASTDLLTPLTTNLNSLNRFNDSSKDLNVMDFDEAERHYNEVRERALANGGTPGIPTGISFIDSAYTTGLSGGDLVVVLGWTGRAKSLFTTLIACNAYMNGYRPMIISMEMSGEKLRDRIWTILGSGLWKNSDLTLGDIGTDNFRTFRKANEGKGDFMVVSQDGVGEMTPAIAQTKVDQWKPNMLIFDYAQLAFDNALSADMTTRMRNQSMQWKGLSVMNDIPTILISSATPDSSTSLREPPMIEQVAWSKQLSYDADLAIAVHRHDNANIVQITGRKNRNGDLFDAALEWDINNGIFKEVFDVV